MRIYLFSRPHYSSDATLFIDQLKAKKPELEAQQRAGRALLWDKQIDRPLAEEIRQSRLPQRPYVYQTQEH